jgi:hypothetical protein
MSTISFDFLRPEGSQSTRFPPKCLISISIYLDMPKMELSAQPSFEVDMKAQVLASF